MRSVASERHRARLSGRSRVLAWVALLSLSRSLFGDDWRKFAPDCSRQSDAARAPTTRVSLSREHVTRNPLRPAPFR